MFHALANGSRLGFSGEQRSVAFTNTYDQGNRLTQVDITKPGAVEGETKRTYAYDHLNRLTTARNNFAQIGRAYDDLSRLIKEEQSIRLDGTGFTNGYSGQIDVLSNNYDLASNRGQMQVKLATAVELEVNTTFDDLYRTNVVSAEYFDQAEHTIADYDYFGYRLLKKTMGNGAALNVGYDGKRRVNDFTWKDTSANVLVGYQYDYDDVDNPLHEKFVHDNNFYDNYQYDALYRLTGEVYREGAAKDYRSEGGIQD